MAHFGLIVWNTVVLDFVETIREPVYDTSRLSRGKRTRTAEGKEAPDAEYQRRSGTRELNEEPSRYYRLSMGKGARVCSKLLSKGKHGHGYSAHQHSTCSYSFLVLSDVENILKPPDQPSP